MLGRDILFSELAPAIAAQPDSGGVLGVMLVRVQRFRQVNLLFADDLGKAAGELIARAMRPVDRVMRIGECDFAVLLPGVRNSQHALLAASRLVRVFREPVQVGDAPIQATVTIGLAVCPEHGEAPEILCRHAEVAFARAQQSGEHYALYSSHEERAEVPFDDLRDAILNNRLEVHLQPIWDLRKQCLGGMESLARWNHRERGLVPPDAFIPLSEQTGLIVPLTRWSVNATLRHCATAFKAGHGLPVSINLSARVFHEQGIVEQVLGALNLWEVPPESVVLEVTENAIMEDPVLSARVLERLRDKGLRIAIDDFGAGYASFSYLKQFPASELKIDRSFVKDMLVDPRAAQLVRAMIDLAHHLKIDAVAEGVEDKETADRLIGMGCDFGQGWYFGRPQPADTFIASL
ncbi:putative bifunctional diguanylate cyclase/phosphodiesterase [Arenimonas oryziterrae]|uniref:GGDEF domain-containing protein n=1 Tax=Arenimonas oryziterrae DSM 21050 = YC6267 TaxID=1121015 RepID=A0A091AZY6_9GAMM|nr:phosphodiesterase [Arenimonas oryziterrae]KFN44867.1 hypothetical protein N789_02290 [Arenimonas oryziterrae DSM 21050 = YC6267]